MTEDSGPGPARRVAGNAVAHATGELVGKFAIFALLAVLTRVTGEEGLGALVLGLAYAEIISVFVRLGLDRLLIRRMSEARTPGGRRLPENAVLFWDTLALKALLSVLVSPVLVVLLLAYPSPTGLIIALLVVAVLLDTLADSCFSVLTAMERNGLVSIASITGRLFLTLSGIGALLGGFGVTGVAVAYTAASAVGLGVALATVARGVGLPPLAIDRSHWPELLRVSAVFGVNDALGTLLMRVGIVLLSLTSSAAAVGLYGGAFRLFEATIFIGFALNAAFTAMFTYLGPTTSPSITGVFRRSLKLAAATLVAPAVLCLTLAEPILVLVFGSDLAGGAGSLRILAGVIVAYGFVTLSASLVLSRRAPGSLLPLLTGCLVLNAVANLVLVPLLGPEGAALAMLVTMVVYAAATTTMAARTAGGLELRRVLAAPLAAGAAMAICTLWLPVAPLVRGAAGLPVYLLVLVAVERSVDPADARMLGELLRRRLGAARARA